MIFECPNCGNTRTESKTRTLSRGGELRVLDVKGITFLDECPECGTRCETHSSFEGLAVNRKGGDSGNGGKSMVR